MPVPGAVLSFSGRACLAPCMNSRLLPLVDAKGYCDDA